MSSSAIRIAVCGTNDAALSTKVLPVVMASGVIHPIGIIAGKFHGAMPTNTPSGSR
jgi:hypothetical protein